MIALAALAVVGAVMLGWAALAFGEPQGRHR